MINAKIRKKIIREILGKEEQLSLFPYNENIEINCISIKTCYKENKCDSCRYARLKYKDYNYYTNPKKIE